MSSPTGKEAIKEAVAAVARDLRQEEKSVHEALAAVASNLRIWRIMIMVAVAIPSAILGYWSSDRSPPFTVVGSDPSPDPAYLGDHIDIGWHVVTHRHGCHSTFRRKITDSSPSQGVWLDARDYVSAYGDLEIGPVHHMHTTQPFILPAVSPGRAEIEIIFKSHCNPLHEWWPIENRGIAHINVGRR